MPRSLKLGDLSPGEQNALRARVLERLERAAFSNDVVKDMPEYDAAVIKWLIQAFLATGDIQYIRGNTRGTIYYITDAGRERLARLKR